VLERAGVEQFLGVGIARVEPDHIVLDGGTVLATRTVVWAAGVRANPLLEALGVELDRSGRVAVEADLSLAGHPEVSVVGDAARIEDGYGTVVPQVAPAAMQQGRHAAEQVLRRIAGQSTTPFHYRDKGSMATIGRNAAVNEYPFGLELRGLLAWLAWLFLHLLYLAGFRNRLSALLTWGWSYLTFDRTLRVVAEPTPRPAGIAQH
jgi:NADH:ubiquinone reductase (H+-translocating)